MSSRSGCVTTGLLILLLTACGQGAETDPGTSELALVQRLTDDVPAVLLARVRDAYEQTVMKVRVTRQSSEQGPYTLVAGQDAWQVQTPTAEGNKGDGLATLLVTDDVVCFDRDFRPVLSEMLLMTYGIVDFDPEPWSCTAVDFGLNTLATHTFRREDPRWRIENLTTDPGSTTLKVEEVDGEPLLHLSTTGVTYDGPLDPPRPAYDLWLGGDLLPVRMETSGLEWEFDYPSDLADELTAPAPEERGSYGYNIGPGQGTAKACYLGGPCPERKLTWGDGR